MGTRRVVKRSNRSVALTGTRRAPLLRDLRDLITAAHQTVARGVNTALVSLYWRIGTRIRTDILDHRRAGYGEQIVGSLGRQLANEFGAGFDRDNLHRMIQFAEAFPNE